MSDKHVLIFAAALARNTLLVGFVCLAFGISVGVGAVELARKPSPILQVEVSPSMRTRCVTWPDGSGLAWSGDELLVVRDYEAMCRIPLDEERAAKCFSGASQPDAR